MNSRLKRGIKSGMTAVATAVVLATVGATVAPTAMAATGTPGGTSAPDAPAELLAELAERAQPSAGPATKAGMDPNVGAFRRAGTNEFIVYFEDDWSTSAVRVDVRRVGSDEVVAVVDTFDYWDGSSGESGVPDDPSYYVGNDDPLVLDAMGDYELDVVTKDRNGQEQTRRSAGRFTYALDAKFEVQSSQEEFSLDDLDTTVTGSVTAVDPTTGERKPLAGAAVRAQLGWGAANVITDAQGKFTTPVAARGTEKDLSLSVTLLSGNEVAGTAPARIRAQKAALTMSTTTPSPCGGGPPSPCAAS